MSRKGERPCCLIQRVGSKTTREVKYAGPGKVFQILPSVNHSCATSVPAYGGAFWKAGTVAGPCGDGRKRERHRRISGLIRTGDRTMKLA